MKISVVISNNGLCKDEINILHEHFSHEIFMDEKKQITVIIIITLICITERKMNQKLLIIC